MRPTNGSRSERDLVAIWREIDGLKSRTRQIPSSWPNFPTNDDAQAITRDITQAAHGFSVGQVVGIDIGGSTWQYATATDYNDIIGVVTVATANTFTVCIAGKLDIGASLYITGSPLGSATASPDVLYYLDGGANAGNTKTTRPTTPNLIRAAYLGLEGGGIYVLGAALMNGHVHNIWDMRGMGLDDPYVTPPDNDDTLLFHAPSLTWRAAPVTVADDAITDAKLRDSVGTSVIGRSASSAGDPADIVAGADGEFLRRKAGTVDFGGVEADDLAPSATAGQLLVATSATGMAWEDVADAVTPADIGAVDTTTFAGHSHTLTGDVGGNLGATVIGAKKVLAGMIGDNEVGGGQLAQVAAWGVIGNPTAALANATGIAAGADGRVLMRRASVLDFYDLKLDELEDVAITTPASGDLLSHNGTNFVNRTGTLAADAAKLMPLGDFASTASLTSAGAGTHNFTAGKKFVMAILRGSGGGGGGGTATTGSASGAGGGGGQGELRVIIARIGAAANMSYTVGAAGGGGSATGANGTAGSATSITLNGTTYSAAGGGAGQGGGGSDGHGGFGGRTTSAPNQAAALDFPVHGAAGQPGRLRSVSYDGAGAVLGLTHVQGLGGGSGAGAGGAGGTAGSAGSSGSVGSIEVYER